MKILNSKIKCPVCVSNSYLKNIENSYKIFRCSSCYLLFVHPIPEKKENAEIIEYWGDDNIKNSASNINKYIKVNRFFLNILKKYNVKNNIKTKVLDIGCGYGFFVKLLNENNFDAYGLDISKQSTYFAKNNLNLKNIINNDFSEKIFEDNYFDFIIALNLLEHVPDPKYILKIINKKIKKDGKLIIRIPNMSFHYNFKFLIKIIHNKKYSLIATNPPVHLYGYSLRNLKKLIEDNNFKVIQTGPSMLGLSKRKYFIKNIFIVLSNLIFKSIFIFTFNKVNISPSIYVVSKKL